MSRNHDSDPVRRLIHRLRVFLKVFFRYIAFPLRVVHRLCRTLLQFYYNPCNVVSRRQFRRIHTDGHPERIAGSSQPTMPLPPSNLNSRLQVPQSPRLTSSGCSSGSLLPVHAPPPSSNNLLNSPPAAPADSQNLSTIKFEPFVPSDVMRYDKPPTIDPAAKSREFISPLTRDFVDARESGNWHACIHPEGALYFHDPMRGVYTDSDLRNQDRRQKMDPCVDELLALIPPELGCKNRELVVQLAFNRKAKFGICRYYFVDHDKHLLFWLHPLSTVKLFCGLQGVEKPSHIKYAVEHQYWQHCEMYPNAKLQRASLLKDLKEVVVHASAETITTDVSLSPFDGDELSKILDLISQLGEPESVGDAYTLCVIARFMRYFVRAKFFNFCGLPAARLDADQTVYKKKKKKKLIVVLSWAFNVAMFGAPKSHMQELRRVWVDRSINSPRWKNFNTKLSNEWSGITMYSTVMVAVDVSFLAVPSVSIQNSGSVTIISTYLSMFCIVGSLVVSLFLTRQNRLYGQESADTAVQFLTKMTGSAFGTKAVATVHGLPYAMLLWGMLYFMLAFSYEVFTSTPTLTLATTGSTCALVVLFTLWLVYAARDFHISTRFLGWLRASIWKASSKPDTA